MMTEKNLPIARRVAAQLFETERALDGALSSAATLAGYLPQARQEVQLSAAVGQDAIEELLQTMVVIGEARRRLVATHQALANVQGRMGLRERNYGAFIDKPRDKECASLTLVDRQVAA
jgi:hypothetical protein